MAVPLTGEMRPEQAEQWFPEEIFGNVPATARQTWMDQQLQSDPQSHLIDPAWFRFMAEHGRVPMVDDTRRPWAYKGWLLYYVQNIHEQVAWSHYLRDLAHYSGEPMPEMVWTRTVRDRKGKERIESRVPMIVPRWHYLFKTFRAGRLLDEPIPALDFQSAFVGERKQVLSSFERWVEVAERDGRGWSALTSFIEWLGWALGVHDQPPKMSEAACEELYRTLDLIPVMEWPCDYLGALASDRFGGGPNAFFPTPHEVVECMARMCMHDITQQGRDPRGETVLDCCLGSGRMLLHASNYSLRLAGQDVDWLVLLCAKINFALYAPWAVAPLPEAYFGDTPPGPPWQLADAHQMDVFLDDHLAHYKRQSDVRHQPFFQQIKQVLALLDTQVGNLAQEPVHSDELEGESAQVAEPMQAIPPLPAEVVSTPGLVAISGPNEQSREVPLNAQPIAMTGIQLGLFNLPPVAKKSRR